MGGLATIEAKPLRLFELNLNLDLLNWSITILSGAITSYFCYSSNWALIDAFYIRSYKMPGKKANRLQRSIRPIFCQNNGKSPE